MKISILVCFFLTSFLFAQDYDDALRCFLAEDYVCAKNNFSNITNNSEELSGKIIEYSHYYLFLSALNLYNKDTESLFEVFMVKFPFSEKKDDEGDLKIPV